MKPQTAQRILLVLFFSFLCGCAQPLHNSSVLHHKNKTLVGKKAPGTEGVKTSAQKQKADDRFLETDRTDLAELAEGALEKAEEAGNAADAVSDEPEADSEIQKSLNEAAGLCDKSQQFWQKEEEENALNALDQAYSLILAINTEDGSELMEQKEKLRFTISKRILEIYASRSTGVNGKHNAIPRVMNEYVRAEIELLLRKGRNGEDCFFIRAYKRSGKYRPYIVAEFEKAGLPAELSWLPLIESGFNIYAFSNARALGMWQFIQSTGAKFGLKHSKFIDERLDPEKSTKAAIGYLKELHQIFGDWTTVLAAYNCGEGRVLQEIRQQNVNYLDNFWDLYRRLPQETASFVPRFLATLHIIADPKKYGIDSITPYEPPTYETVNISKQIHLKDVAEAVGSTQAELRELNPELRHNIVPGDGEYVLRIPPNKTEALLAGLDSIPEASSLSEKSEASSSSDERKASSDKKSPSPRIAYRYHRIKRGETLSGIARRYHISVKTVMANNRVKKRHISAGNILKIPAGTISEVRADKPYTKKEKERHRIAKHVVRKGESIWNIARRYGTTATEILGLNRLSKNTRLHVGQVLKIPKAGRNEKASAEDVKGKKYRVKRGDAPRDIAKRHNMELKRFLRVNDLTQKARIYPGQQLYVE